LASCFHATASITRYLGNQPPIQFHCSCFQAFCHIVPSLRLFIANTLTVYHRSFFFWGLCSWHLLVAQGFSFLFTLSTTTIAPSLCALIPSGTLINFCQFLPHCRCFVLFIFFSLSLKRLGACVSTLLASALPVVSFSFLERVDPFRRSGPSFFVGLWTFSLLVLWTPFPWFSWRPCYRFPCFPVMAGVFFSIIRYSWQFSSLSSDVPVPRNWLYVIMQNLAIGYLGTV
jgi:hypothetical protein